MIILLDDLSGLKKEVPLLDLLISLTKAATGEGPKTEVADITAFLRIWLLTHKINWTTQQFPTFGRAMTCI